MCGRVVLTYSLNDLVHILKDTFYINHVPNVFVPYHYNIAPSDPLPCMIANEGGYRLGSIPWGYPSPVTPSSGRVINIRSEKVESTAMFKDDLKNHRLVVLCNGFIEWTLDKRPFYFTYEDGSLMYLAALWGKHTDGTYHCGVLTEQSQSVVKPIHERMPVILNASETKQWLDPAQKVASLAPLYHSLQHVQLTTRPLSREVNNAKNKSESLFIEQRHFFN